MSSETVVRAWRTRRAIFMIGCLVQAGCLSSDRVTSTGTVTYEGHPVETGSIVFRSLDGPAGAAGAVVTHGRFVVKVRPGKHRVEIRGTRPIDPAKLPRTMPRFEGLPVHEDYIPPAFNAASTLEVEVASRGPNVFSFDLTPSSPTR